MEKFLDQMAEIMEVDGLNATDELKSFDAWDSLTTLSIIAMADDEYGVSLSNQEIIESQTVEGLFDLIKAKKNA